MKSLVMILISLFSLQSFAQTASMDVTPKIPLIEGKAFSCLAQKTGATVPDIQSSHISVDRFSINNSSNEALNVSLVRISVATGLDTYTCEYAGDALFATGLTEVIAADSSSAIDCPLFCGGIAPLATGPYPAAVEVYGFFEDKSGNQSPLKIRLRTEVVAP